VARCAGQGECAGAGADPEQQVAAGEIRTVHGDASGNTVAPGAMQIQYREPDL
jgi:hypothetical protein